MPRIAVSRETRCSLRSRTREGLSSRVWVRPFETPEAGLGLAGRGRREQAGSPAESGRPWPRRVSLLSVTLQSPGEGRRPPRTSSQRVPKIKEEERAALTPQKQGTRHTQTGSQAESPAARAGGGHVRVLPAHSGRSWARCSPSTFRVEVYVVT